MAASQDWYYAKGDQQFGPVSTADLKQLVESGGLSPTDMIWKEEWPEWKAARTIKGLFNSVPPSTPSPAPPPLPRNAPPALPTTKGNRSLLLIGAGAGGFMLLMCVCCGGLGLVGDGGTRNSRAIVDAKPEDIITITSYQLFSEYEANDIAADKKYKGKVLQVSGSVGDISRDILDSIYVTLKTGEFKIFSIQCFFADSFEDEAAKLRPHQFLTIRGRCDGKFGNVMLKDCIIVR